MTTTTRRLIAADIENLLGTNPPLATAECWDAAFESLTAALGYDPTGDHLVVAVDPSWAFEVHARAPQARLLVRAGASGADRALCDELADVSFIARRYDRVVVASGDHEFVSPVAALGLAGVPVTVAALAVQCSPVLAAVADDVVWLTRPARVTVDPMSRLLLAA